MHAYVVQQINDSVKVLCVMIIHKYVRARSTMKQLVLRGTNRELCTPWMATTGTETTHESTSSMALQRCALLHGNRDCQSATLIRLIRPVNYIQVHRSRPAAEWLLTVLKSLTRRPSYLCFSMATVMGATA